MGHEAARVLKRCSLPSSSSVRSAACSFERCTLATSIKSSALAAIPPITTGQTAMPVYRPNQAETEPDGRQERL